jgi:hypothetical protein
MKTIKELLGKYLVALIVITGFQCAAAAVAPVFVALIGAKNWQDESVQLPDDHHFNFVTVDTPDSNYSKFEGNEHTVGNNTLHFTGFYSNHDIQFTYDDDAIEGRANKTYKGTVNNASTEMTLKGTDAVDPLPAVTLTSQ